MKTLFLFFLGGTWGFLCQPPTRQLLLIQGNILHLSKSSNNAVASNITRGEKQQQTPFTSPNSPTRQQILNLQSQCDEMKQRNSNGETLTRKLKLPEFTFNCFQSSFGSRLTYPSFNILYYYLVY